MLNITTNARELKFDTIISDVQQCLSSYTSYKSVKEIYKLLKDLLSNYYHDAKIKNQRDYYLNKLTTWAPYEFLLKKNQNFVRCVSSGPHNFITMGSWTI